MTGASANQSSIFASSLPAQSLSDSPDGSASVSLLTLFHFFFSLTIYSPYSGLALSFTDLFVIFTPLLRSFHVHFSARRCQRGAHARDALPTPVITRALLFLRAFVSCFLPRLTSVSLLCILNLHIHFQSGLIFHLRNKEADLVFASLQIANS